MQNTKIQTLWNLCNELKEKRQFLVEKLRHTQDYLDEQQWHLSREVHNLKQQTHHLSHEVSTLVQALETVYSLWSIHQKKQDIVPSNSILADFFPLLDCARLQQDLFWRFYELTITLQQLKPEIMQDSAPEIFQEGFQELFSEFTEQIQLFRQSSAKFNNLQEQALTAPDNLPDFSNLMGALSAYAEFLNSFSEDLQGFQAQWQASIPYRQPIDQTAEIAHLQQELGAVRTAMYELQTEKASREKLLVDTYSQAYASAAALAELQSNNNDLTREMNHLLQVLENFQQMLHHNILPVAASAPLSPSPSGRDEDMDVDFDAESPESDRQIIREAVQESSRKRIAQILKKRFSKVPRRVHTLLKKIEVSSRLDKLFELALECDSIEQFSSQLEDSAS